MPRKLLKHPAAKKVLYTRIPPELNKRTKYTPELLAEMYDLRDNYGFTCDQIAQTYAAEGYSYWNLKIFILNKNYNPAKKWEYENRDWKRWRKTDSANVKRHNKRKRALMEKFVRKYDANGNPIATPDALSSPTGILAGPRESVPPATPPAPPEQVSSAPDNASRFLDKLHKTMNQ